MKRSVFMKKFLVFILAFSTLFILTNCSVQKRHFTKGWDIQWKSTKDAKSDTKRDVLTSENAEVDNEKVVLNNAVDSLICDTKIPESKIQINEKSDKTSNIQFVGNAMSTLQKTSLPKVQLKEISKQLRSKKVGSNDGNSIFLLWIGIALFLLGIVLMLGCINELRNSVSLHELVIAFLGIVAGFVMFLIGLILLIIAIEKLTKNKNADNMSQNKSPQTGLPDKESQVEKPIEVLTNQQKPKKTKEQQAKDRKSIWIALGFLVVAITVFLVIRN